MMHQARTSGKSGAEVRDDLYPQQQVLEAVASLRDHVCSMETRLREVLQSQVSPRASRPTVQPRRRPGATGVLSDAVRVKREVDALVQRYEAARYGSPAPTATTHVPSNEAHNNDDGSWFKKMMILLLISEMQ